MAEHVAAARMKEMDERITHLSEALAVLSWDQETYMPLGAMENRAAQVGVLQQLIHEATVDDEWGELFSQLGVDENHIDEKLDLHTRQFCRRLWHRYARITKIPQKLAVEFATTTSLAQGIWRAAREESNFNTFAPHLTKIVQLTQEMISCIGWTDQPYDVLLDGYEPWMKTGTVVEIFKNMEARLTQLLQKITAAPQIDDRILHGKFSQEAQHKFCQQLLEIFGYDLNRGRVDQSAHPFTTTLGAHDVRITTRYDEKYFPTSIFGLIHEMGHAFYELGVDPRYHGSILAEGTSLGIHESQSRFWENFIGKSEHFWRYCYPRFQQIFPHFDEVELSTLWRAINHVQPSLIRIDADELTYNLHIILRFNIERRLFSNDIQVKELPEVWREESKRLLGIVPEKESEGVLQDVHWSMGSFGYFPTYALGNLYGAQFLRQQMRDMPDFYERVERGDFASIREWLRTHIHTHGSAYSAEELCRKVTSEPLSADYFISYLEKKYQKIYRL